METNFYAPMLLGKGCICRNGWEKFLSQDYREPQFHITLSRAIGRRLRRTYAYVLTIQALAYLGKIIIHPTPVTSFGEFVQRAAIGPIPGEAILAAGVVFNGVWILFAFVTTSVPTLIEQIQLVIRNGIGIFARYVHEQTQKLGFLEEGEAQNL